MKSEPGDWLDEWGVCKVCGGEIPHGHLDCCHVYKQEQRITLLEEQVKKWQALAEASTKLVEISQRRCARDAELLARQFHNTYERLAPSFGYETREDTRTFDPKSSNGKLMVAVCTELLKEQK